jgi:hypothetical protein
MLKNTTLRFNRKRSAFMTDKTRRTLDKHRAAPALAIALPHVPSALASVCYMLAFCEPHSREKVRCQAVHFFAALDC